ncbi:type II toxin-antitoxin system VapB family antitoxin [Luteipulveratus sp. YIM 133132]|uniref:Type II toxin-antitoxin system VapB family antitoxin n=1 Tax=Luteipulveratus flavus TaxID=3031728 RepID=A0ABT6CBI9_9MICO|nr:MULTISPECIES: type II toxin-antitoxin system VapB family antitoxin [unclassified Luteipulveratus]MDE9364704.1 type II toxin-antitoxin system VapB family antitoxin [Luteipulveratus sp. YIM 133132]MDF8266121.1 type II toxin-antitoxin system VapB family antitoxin [Luteipulveratus sp. YIM 133296]
MGLNIKNERVHALAQEAARRTGQTQTGVIETALERLLAGLGPEGVGGGARIDVLLSEVQRRVAVEGPLVSEGLYDDAGLPR